MEKLLTNELTKYLIILGVSAVGLTAIMMRVLAKVKGSFKPYQKSTILYLLVFVLLIAISAIAALPTFFDKVFTAFIFLQAYFLLLGSFHVYFLNKNIEWTGEKLILPQMLFTIIISVFGCMLFLIVFRWLNKKGFEYVMSSSIFFFVVPFFFYHSFQKAMDIPPKVLKQWFYPVGEEVEEPEDSKMKNLIVISFEFQKHLSDNHVTNFRAKAPRDMEFGQLFYYFINDYNEMHSNSKIQFANSKGDAHGWVFYKKPRWYSIATNYIDAERTIFTNHINENDVIICTRSQI